MRYYRILISVVGVLVVFSLAWQSRATADVAPYYEPAVLKKAERLLRQDKPARAVATVEAALAEPRNNAFEVDAHDILCRAFYALDDYGRAEIACDAALAMSGSAGAWSHLNNRGVMRLLQGRNEQAAADFAAALRRNPLAAAARSNLALAEKVLARQAREQLAGQEPDRAAAYVAGQALSVVY